MVRDHCIDFYGDCLTMVRMCCMWRILLIYLLIAIHTSGVPLLMLTSPLLPPPPSSCIPRELLL
jgi:hypothetical protein